MQLILLITMNFMFPVPEASVPAKDIWNTKFKIAVNGYCCFVTVQTVADQSC